LRASGISRSLLSAAGAAVLLALGLSGCGKRSGEEAAPAQPKLSPAQACLAEAKQATREGEEAAADSRFAEALAAYARAKAKIAEGSKLARSGELGELGALAVLIEPQVVKLEYLRQKAEEERRFQQEQAGTGTGGDLSIGVSLAEEERRRKDEEAARQAQLAAQLKEFGKFPSMASRESAGGVVDDTDPWKPAGSAATRKPGQRAPAKPPKPKPPKRSERR
jgi:hypothetical protein